MVTFRLGCDGSDGVGYNEKKNAHTQADIQTFDLARSILGGRER